MLIAGLGTMVDGCDFVEGYFTCGCKERVIPIHKSCQEPECPICYEDWASKAGARASDNLQDIGLRIGCMIPLFIQDFKEVLKMLRKLRRFVISLFPLRRG